MSKTKLGAAARAMGITIEKKISGYAYPRNGNAHNPTPRYRWEVKLGDRLIDTAYREGAAIGSANEFAANQS